MKNSSYSKLLLILLIFGVSIKALHYVASRYHVEVGDVYIIEKYGCDNPYQACVKDTIKIIDTNGKYCLYVDTKGDTLSKLKISVTSNSEKIN